MFKLIFQEVKRGLTIEVSIDHSPESRGQDKYKDRNNTELALKTIFVLALLLFALLAPEMARTLLDVLVK